MTKQILLSVFFLFSLQLTHGQNTDVSAYQAGIYTPGLINIWDFSYPDDGLVISDYNIWANTNSYRDGHGDKTDQLTINLSPFDTTLALTTIDLDIEIKGYINSFFIGYTFNLPFLNAKYMVALAPSYISANGKAHIKSSNALAEIDVNGFSDGFGDLSIIPLSLYWNFDNKFNIGFLYTLSAPTGRFELDADDNVGNGYWAHMFQIPIYFFNKDQSTAFTVLPTLELNGKIKDSDVTPGNRLSLEYGISQYLNEWLELQILNSHNWQIGSDKGNDIWWRNTALDGKDQTNNLSFGIGAWPVASQFYTSLKYGFDYGTKNRFQANYFSVDLIYIPVFKSKKVTNQ